MLEGRQPLGSFISCDGNLRATRLEFGRDLLGYTNRKAQRQGRLQEQLDSGAQMIPPGLVSSFFIL